MKSINRIILSAAVLAAVIQPAVAGEAAKEGDAALSAESVERLNGTAQPQAPIQRVFPPTPAEQTKAGVGKFVIFTREQVGTSHDCIGIAGAWECIPSQPERPLTKRLEFCHSSWNAGALLDITVSDRSRGMHPRFVRLQVDSADADSHPYTVNLYDINYRTWEVRRFWQGERLRAFGLMGDSIFCWSSDGWLLLDAVSGKLSGSVPFTPIETDGNYWLVRKPGETKGCWSYDPVKRQFVAHFEPVDESGIQVMSRLSPDGKNRAWVSTKAPDRLSPVTVMGRLMLQRNGEKAEISVPIEMQAKMGSGVAFIPVDSHGKFVRTELRFTKDGQVQFRAGERVWSIDIASGKVCSGASEHDASGDGEPVTSDGVPVPDYLQKYRDHGKLSRSSLPVAFLLHLGILTEEPEFPDKIDGVSPDGRHILYAALKGPLSGFYIYGDLLTKQTARWESPDGLDCRDAQEFVWVETPN